MLHACLDLLLPRFCLACGVRLKGRGGHYCPCCLDLLELYTPERRCQRCFNECLQETVVCGACEVQGSPIYRFASCFSYEGPAKNLVTAIKYGGRSGLALSAGSFLLAQLLLLDWPLPDLVVPIPITATHAYKRGFNQSELLAEPICQKLKIPMSCALKRKGGSLPQAALPARLRRRLKADQFIVSKELPTAKNILLIDDVATTGATLRRSAEALLEARPCTIYALTLCWVAP